MSLTMLRRKPDRGLGNIHASASAPSRNIDWVLMAAVALLSIIGLLIMKIVWDAARHIGSRMLDGIEPEVVAAIRSTAAAVPGGHGVHEVRARWVGHRVWTEINVAVDDDISVIDGHEVARAVQHELQHEVPHLGTVVVHVDPVSHGGEHHHAHHHLPW